VVAYRENREGTRRDHGDRDTAGPQPLPIARPNRESNNDRVGD
jgi:hypothetical protein